jgi:hemerythrin
MQMEKIKVSHGLFWVSIPEADLRILCGCPADSVKHLMKQGLISTTRKAGVSFETGPNAILLSDAPIQRGSIANLAEFPVLQMLYRQGMFLPGHPNNTGRRPLLLGSEDQVKSQAEYIFRGNYGLASLDELRQAGVAEAEAGEMMRIKRRFAFDRILRTEELLDMRVIGKESAEIAPGVTIRRRGLNRFQIRHLGKSVEIDLNLGTGEEYAPSYSLGFSRISREYFSVINIGEGDGWNINLPCMGSIVCFQGRLYLIDAGPNILKSLVALGINVCDLEGIFQTHAHDDHFAGLTSLIHMDRRLKYYATPYVRASVEKKLTALMLMRPGELGHYFEVRDLAPEEWNDLDGLEVKPVFSPHPVETTVFFFRTLWERGYKTYAHLADIVDFKILGGMVNDDPQASGVTSAFYKAYTSTILQPVDVKKIDAGGGLIHGNAEDFRNDASRAKYFSHKSGPLSASEKRIGTSAPFGSQDVLVPASRDLRSLATATRYLSASFPGVPGHEIALLANSPAVSFKAGAVIEKSGSTVDALLVILDGVADFIESEDKPPFMLSSGALIGEVAALTGETAQGTYRAASFVTALCVPRDLYAAFVERNGLRNSILQVCENRRFLQSTWLFGEMISFTVANRIAQAMVRRTASAGDSVRVIGESQLAILEKGRVSLSTGGEHFETLGPRGFWDEVTVLEKAPSFFEATAERDSSFFLIPGEVLREIPIVQWKLMETFRKRLSWFRTHAKIEWSEEYALGGRTDGRQKHLFEVVRDLADCLDQPSKPRTCRELQSEVEKEGGRLFAEQENLMKKRRFPELNHHREEHEKMLAQIRRLNDEKGLLQETNHRSMRDFLKDWVLTHTILEDRKLKAFLAVKR